MSYTQYPAVVRAGVPGTADDRSEGFVVGCLWVNSLTSPRDTYVCTDASTGAATWALTSGGGGGTSSHPALTTLGWGASGHTGTANSVACFNGSGATQNVQATQEGSVLTYVGGALTFALYAMTVSYLSERAYSTNYIKLTDAAPAAVVQSGSIA
ncbi:hypothetical protein [Gemmatimonas sp.]|uniref:hypothetical protein n=1 Tax=Gemmatimonas sp. TaxID=1962908 RepID=UPI0027BA903A|nr:hypothetical protein [Gemmatimonas sp.]